MMKAEWFTMNFYAGTVTNYYWISDEDYERIKDKRGTELENEIYPNGIPEDIACGYGFYGCSVGKNAEGRGWISICTGRSCD